MSNMGCLSEALGNIYVNSNTAVDDTARRFETDARFLEDVIIIVKDKAQNFGTAASQVYPVGVNEGIGFRRLNIATLYFKNQNAGQYGTVYLLGTEV